MSLVKLILMGTEKREGEILGYRRLDNYKIIPKTSVKILNKPSIVIIYNQKPVIQMKKEGFFRAEANALLLGQKINSNEYNSVYTASYCKIK